MGRTSSAKAQRALFFAVVTAITLIAFAAIGGVGVAETSVSAAQYQYGKVTLCHVAGKSGERVTITVAAAAVPAHLRHGDTIGPCPRRA